MKFHYRKAPVLFSFAMAALASPAAAAGGQAFASSVQREEAARQPRAEQPMRFRGMDRNGDGVITRAEWRGNDVSFRQEDWNGDGILSGEEVRPDPAPTGAASVPRDEARRTEAQFVERDHDRNGIITRGEWHDELALFERLDANHDGHVNRSEFITRDAPAPLGRRRDFVELDADHNGFVTRGEWPGDPLMFERLDENRDNRLTRAEYAPAVAAPAPAPAPAPVPVETAAHRAGHARGMDEGRAAGREDRERRQGWDLEGQRELEQADSGYAASIGPREEYQAGYRAGFRKGYAEGYGAR